MPLPALTVGLVVRYEYLWARRSRAGAKTADKERPACVVVTFRREGRAEDFVLYLPISHTPPHDDEGGIELPADVKRKAGLDDAPQWILVSEYNLDAWPNDIMSLAHQPDRFHYGHLPPAFFTVVRDRFLDFYRRRKNRGVSRIGS